MPRRLPCAARRLDRLSLAAFLLVTPAAARAQEPCADVTPPALEITTPARAATIEQGGLGDEVVVVAGFAEDADSPLVSLVVDGQELLAQPAIGVQPFAVPTASRWGLSIVTASAEDACGNRVQRAQSYLRSGDWFEAEPTDQVAQALVTNVGQALLDDGDRSDPDDLASLGEAALAGIDLDDEVPQALASDPLRGGCAFPQTWVDTAYTVSRGGALDATALRLPAIDSGPSGVQARLELDSLDLPLAATVRFRSCVTGLETNLGPVTVTGTFVGSDLSATGTVVPSLVGGELQVDVESVSVDLGVLDVAIDCNAIQFVCNAGDAIANAVLDRLEVRLADLLEDVLVSELGPMLEGFLAELRPWQTIDLPPPIDVTIDVDGGLEQVDTSEDGVGLRYGVRLQPREAAPNLPPDARGAIRRGGLPSGVAGGDALRFEAKDDFVNQLFWAVWFGGGLDLPDLRAEAVRAGFAVERLSFQAQLPPVLRSGEAVDRVEVGFGDAFVELTLDLAPVLGPGTGTLDVAFWFSAFLDGELGLSPPERLRFDVLGVRAESEIVAASNPALAEALRPLLDELLAVVAQRIVDQALGGLRLPTIDLATSFPAADVPEGAVLGLASDAVVERPTDSYTRLAGDVAVQIPVPEPGPLAAGLAAAAALAAARTARRID